MSEGNGKQKYGFFSCLAEIVLFLGHAIQPYLNGKYYLVLAPFFIP